LFWLADAIKFYKGPFTPSSPSSRPFTKPTGPVGLADSPMVDLANLPEKFSNRPSEISSDVGANLCDWRIPLLAYLCDLSAKLDKSVRRSTFTYVLHNDELYRRIDEYRPDLPRGSW
jgi:hypothetical protein